MSLVRRLAMLFGILALVLAACGGGPQEEELPINTGDEPPAAGACLVDEPDCNDIGVPNDGGALPPPGDDGDAVTGGMVADGGLTVSEALITEVEGVIGVQGFLFDDGSGPVLCEVLAESFPPQCGGASLEVSGHEEAVGVPIIAEQGVTWTDQPLMLFGEIVDGTFVVDPTVLG